MRVRHPGIIAAASLGLYVALSLSWATNAPQSTDMAAVLLPAPQLPSGALLHSEGGRQLPLFLDRHESQRGLSGRATAGTFVLAAALALVESIVAAMRRRARVQGLLGAVLDRGPPVPSRTGLLALS
jgi:hypothetical protein